MPTIPLFERDGHRNLLLEEFGRGEAVQANLHLVVHQDHGLLLDPGGLHVLPHAVPEVDRALGARGTLDVLFFSHQDPDAAAAANGWLMSSAATAYISAVWTRFIPHFGLDRLVLDRIRPIPDEGMWIRLGDARLAFLPAHFLHSAGNFQVWDPTSRILYSGDLGASLGVTDAEVTDFDAHLPYLAPFHERYMPSPRALRAWTAMARTLPIEVIAPQHGAFFRGAAMVGRFLDWCDGLVCGADLLPPAFKVPG